MEAYFFEKWKGARKEVRKSGATLFSMLSLFAKFYSIASLAVSVISIPLFLLPTASMAPWFPMPDMLRKCFRSIPYLHFSYLCLGISILLMFGMRFIVYPVDRDTKRERLDEYYAQLKTMLTREGIVKSDVCEALCSSIQIQGESEIQRVRHNQEFIFNLLLFFGGAASAFVIDSYFENGISVQNYDRIAGLLVLAVIVVCMFACHLLFSKRSNIPYLKLSCAADLRIAFHYGAKESSQNYKSKLVSETNAPKHMSVSEDVRHQSCFSTRNTK